MLFNVRGGELGMANDLGCEHLPIRFRPGEPRVDPLPDNGSFKFGEDPAHLEHGLTGGGGGVGPLTMWVQVDAENGMYFKAGIFQC
jgi:hypothetical protein